MQNYEIPECELVNFNTADIITTSGGDKVPGDTDTPLVPVEVNLNQDNSVSNKAW